MTVWSAFPRETEYFGPSKQPLMVNYRVSDLDALFSHVLEQEPTAVLGFSSGAVTALTYARIRHPDSDFERGRRQQAVLLALAPLFTFGLAIVQGLERFRLEGLVGAVVAGDDPRRAAATAVQRRMPTGSPRTSAASAVTISGAIPATACTSASGR